MARVVFQALWDFSTTKMTFLTISRTKTMFVWAGLQSELEWACLSVVTFQQNNKILPRFIRSGTIATAFCVLQEVKINLCQQNWKGRRWERTKQQNFTVLFIITIFIMPVNTFNMVIRVQQAKVVYGNKTESYNWIIRDSYYNIVALRL